VQFTVPQSSPVHPMRDRFGLRITSQAAQLRLCAWSTFTRRLETMDASS
jgi:hypothetical protein